MHLSHCVVAATALVAGCSVPRVGPPRDVLPPRQAQDIVLSTTPVFIAYQADAGRSAQAQTDASEAVSARLLARGLRRVALATLSPRSVATAQFSGLLGEAVFQLNCQGACAGLVISISSEGQRHAPAEVDASLPFPLVTVRNPTFYPQGIEIDIDRQSLAAGQQFELTVSHWQRSLGYR